MRPQIVTFSRQQQIYDILRWNVYLHKNREEFVILDRKIAQLIDLEPIAPCDLNERVGDANLRVGEYLAPFRLVEHGKRIILPKQIGPARQVQVIRDIKRNLIGVKAVY